MNYFPPPTSYTTALHVHVRTAYDAAATDGKVWIYDYVLAVEHNVILLVDNAHTILCVPNYMHFPLGCFTCAKCKEDKCMDFHQRAYALIDRHSKTLAHPGLVCSQCVSEIECEMDRILAEPFIVNVDGPNMRICDFILLTSDETIKQKVVRLQRDHVPEGEVPDRRSVDAELNRRQALRDWVGQRILAKVMLKRLVKST